jgi:uncharacterized protein
MHHDVVDTADLGSDRVELEGVFPPGTLAIDAAGVEQSGDVTWSGYIERQGARIRLAGTVGAVLYLPCDRCLELARLDIRRDFDLFFEPRDEAAYEEHEEIELAENDMGTSFMTGTEISLGDVVAEQLMLALPMKPLCGSECRGLCPGCGQNLNNARCDCTVQTGHPAMEALQALKERMEGRESGSSRR